MVDTGWVFGGSAGQTNASAFGGASFSNINNVLNSNTSSASATLSIGAYTNILYVTDFGFNIPEDAGIWGVETRCFAYTSNSTAGFIKAKLWYNGEIGSNFSDTAINPREGSFIGGSVNANGQYFAFGGEESLWDLTTLTPNSVNSSDFGCCFQFESRSFKSTTLNVRIIQCKVYYKVPGGSGEVYVQVRDGGVWKPAGIRVKSDGEWKTPTSVYVKKEGVWVPLPGGGGGEDGPIYPKFPTLLYSSTNYTSGTTFTVPSNIDANSIIVRACGAGGGGGGGNGKSTGSNNRGGRGGNAFGAETVIPVTPGENLTLVVGRGGGGGRGGTSGGGGGGQGGGYTGVFRGSNALAIFGGGGGGGGAGLSANNLSSLVQGSDGGFGGIEGRYLTNGLNSANNTGGSKGYPGSNTSYGPADDFGVGSFANGTPGNAYSGGAGGSIGSGVGHGNVVTFANAGGAGGKGGVSAANGAGGGGGGGAGWSGGQGGGAMVISSTYGGGGGGGGASYSITAIKPYDENHGAWIMGNTAVGVGGSSGNNITGNGNGGDGANGFILIYGYLK